MNKQIPSDLQKTLLSEEVALLSDLHYMQEADDERELDNIIKGYEQLLKSVFQCSKDLQEIKIMMLMVKHPPLTTHCPNKSQK